MAHSTYKLDGALGCFVMGARTMGVMGCGTTPSYILKLQFMAAHDSGSHLGLVLVVVGLFTLAE